MKIRVIASVIALVVGVPFVAAENSSASTMQTQFRVHLNRSTKFAPNSSVQVVAWPNATVLSKLKPGERVPVVTVASARTDARGDAALVMDATNLPDTYSDGLGQLSLEVRVTSGARLADYTLPSPRGSQQSLVIDPDHGPGGNDALAFAVFDHS